MRDQQSVSTMHSGRRRRAHGASPRPPSEDLVDLAIQRLDELAKRARSNVAAQGRDPGGARVALTWWQASLGLQRARFRALLAELERRGLVHVDGAFVAPTWEAA